MHNYFDRAAVKSRAKAALGKCYWLAVAVSAIVSLILGELSLPNFSVELPISSGEAGEFQAQLPFSMEPPLPGAGKLAPMMVAFVVLFVMLIAALIIAGGLVKAYFLDGVITVGGGRFYLGVTRGKARFGDLFFGFGAHYRNVRRVLFARYWRLLLWKAFLLIPAVGLCLGVVILNDGGRFLGSVAVMLSILGIVPAMIPALIKGYEYSMIPYLMAEFPEMSVAEAFAATRELTEGRKGDLFALDLSFLGWRLLAAMSFGVGIVFLQPYIQSSWAESYAEICRLRYPPAPTPFEPIAPSVYQETVIQTNCTEEENEEDC